MIAALALHSISGDVERKGSSRKETAERLAAQIAADINAVSPVRQVRDEEIRKANDPATMHGNPPHVLIMCSDCPNPAWCREENHCDKHTKRYW